jgi:hypothetical protein
MASLGGGAPTEQLLSTQLSAYPPDAIGAELKGHRYWAQTQMGIWIAGAVLGALLVTVGLIAYLAIDKRQASYIASVGEALQPFVLPTLGALVGYALRTAQDRGDP